MSDVDQSVSNPAQGLKKIKGVEGVCLVSGLYDVVATVRGRWVVIMGEVVGNVQASERVELKGAARVFGEMEALRRRLRSLSQLGKENSGARPASRQSESADEIQLSVKEDPIQ